ncbi:hypothetical protein VNO77_43138 [Canavalia gladiata]|uniref:Plant thionin family protein n=1 Tax=Canavalia gladiata TaxID=3824 RepID=A0AAN9JW99_CANGL
MASTKSIATLLISLVITMAYVKGDETLSDCAKSCMPVCLKENGASMAGCGTACESYCDQISKSFKGNPYSNSIIGL